MVNPYQKIHDAAIGKLKKLDFILKNKHSSSELKRHLYIENIRSQMLYGSIGWAFGKGKRNTDKLSKIQKTALQDILNITEGHLAAMEGELGLPSLENMFNLDLAKFHMKIQRMDDERIPKRIYNRPWSKVVENNTRDNKRAPHKRRKVTSKHHKHSMHHITKTILRKWKTDINLNELLQIISAETGKDQNEITTDNIKSFWNKSITEGMDTYTKRRSRNNRSKHNRFYKKITPATKHIKPYILNPTNSNRLLAAAICSQNNPQQCPLCKMQDIILPRHIIATCGGTYKPRLQLLKKFGIPHKPYRANNQEAFINAIYDKSQANPTDAVEHFMEIAAASYDLAKHRQLTASPKPGNLNGKIVDVRQNGVWFRTRVVRHDQFKENEIIVDSTDFDDWPEFWQNSEFTLDIEDLRNLSALKLRGDNVLSFTKFNNNTNKIIYINNSAVILRQHIENGVYHTDNGKLNLMHIIRRGQLNSCFFNGNVARRYNSADGASPMPTGKD